MSALTQLPGAEIPYLRLPEPALLFAARAQRLLAIAGERGGDPFLTFLGRLATAQRAAAAAVPGFTPPRAPGRPLDRDALAGDPALGTVLTALLAALPAPGLPEAAAGAVRGLRDASPDALRRIAAGVLDGRSRPDDVAAATFVGAAVQVLATVRAARLDPAGVARVESGCPVCGAAPVAGVVQGDDRLRYLTCSLCAAEWHLPRIRCAGCQTTAGLAYQHLENDPGARAETCAACQGYVKLFDLEKRPGSEPFADDAATLALDLLLGEAGHGRIGPNLFLPVAG